MRPSSDSCSTASCTVASASRVRSTRAPRSAISSCSTSSTTGGSASSRPAPAGRARPRRTGRACSGWPGSVRVCSSPAWGRWPPARSPRWCSPVVGTGRRSSSAMPRPRCRRCTRTVGSWWCPTPGTCCPPSPSTRCSATTPGPRRSPTPRRGRSGTAPSSRPPCRPRCGVSPKTPATPRGPAGVRRLPGRPIKDSPPLASGRPEEPTTPGRSAGASWSAPLGAGQRVRENRRVARAPNTRAMPTYQTRVSATQ